MKKKMLALGIFAAAAMIGWHPSAQAGSPLSQTGFPGFRPAYLKSDGPQPFSTRRSRELQAARGQGGNGLLFSNASTRDRPLLRVLQSRRPQLFSRLGGRFR